MDRRSWVNSIIALVAAFSLPVGVDACQRERHFRNHNHAKRQITPPAALTPDEQFITSTFDNNSISDWSYYYTHGAHLGGKNKTMAQWTADRWSEAGLNSRLDSYHVYLNYPVSKSLVVNWPNGTTYTPSLEEDVLDADDVTGWPNRIPTFHGYSASGEATAEFVYVGRGQQADFDRLVALGVPLEGKIAVSRYGGPFRGLKVKNAQDHGMIAAVIFTDPGDDGNITVANGYAAYPDGPARNPSSVQRGSVQFLSTFPGDPTTPGYPSKKDSPRADRSAVTPQIPSIPISYADAGPILAALDGSGFTNDSVRRANWEGGLNATYASGPAPGVTISLANQMEGEYNDIWNAIAIINGTNADETIIIGNHRDAWIIGGAADPNSGTAVIVELGRVLGGLVRRGWKPRRNIVLCSWDGEEYGMLGSTEWVEEFIPWLKETAVSYLNIDVGIAGAHPYIAATPELHAISSEIMKKVMWPAFGGNETMYDVWMDDTEGEIEVLGSGSDYTSFVHRGISSVDMGAGGGPTDPIWHYHSNYDSYHWMATFGDPGFLVHKAMGQYLSLLAYHLASDDLLPLAPTNYADQMDMYYDDLRSLIDSSSGDLDTSPLRDAIDTFRVHANEAVALAELAVQSDNADLLQVVNHKLRDFQRGFTSQGGLPEREFYQHLIFAPGLDTGYAPATFPGVTEAIEIYGDWAMAAEFVAKTAQAINVAGEMLKT